MIWFRRYLSLFVPLVALLVGIESILLINRAVLSHEDFIGKNYSIIIVAQKPIDEDSAKAQISEIATINRIEVSGILDEINAEFGGTISADFGANLPLFYAVGLHSFPNQYKIRAIKADLLALPNVSRVESFTKTHTQTYRLLVFIKGCVIVFSSIIFILSFLLMIKQVEVWRFEHSERMEIMTYLGASSKVKNLPLYRLALISTIIASVVVMAMVIALLNNNKIASIISMLGIEIFSVKALIIDEIILLVSAYAISMFSVFMVILFQKEP